MRPLTLPYPQLLLRDMVRDIAKHTAVSEHALFTSCPCCRGRATQTAAYLGRIERARLVPCPNCDGRGHL